MKKYLVGMLAGAALFVATIPALAGTTVQTAVTIDVPKLADVTWAAGGTTLGLNPILSDMIAGFKTNANFGTLQTDANCSYNITVEAAATDFTGTGSGTKPTSELKITLAGTGTTGETALNGTTAVPVISGGAAGVATGHQVGAKVILAADDTVGTYLTTLTFTIVAL